MAPDTLRRLQSHMSSKEIARAYTRREHSTEQATNAPATMRHGTTQCRHQSSQHLCSSNIDAGASDEATQSDHTSTQAEPPQSVCPERSESANDTLTSGKPEDTGRPPETGFSTIHKVPTDADIDNTITTEPMRPMGTTVSTGPYTIENLDPRSNDRLPMGENNGLCEAVPLSNKQSYGCTIEQREDITPAQYDWIAERMETVRHCFAETMQDLPGYKNMKFDIEFEDESKVAYQKWRKLAGPQKEFADKICQEMLDCGVIEKASPHVRHCSNVVIAPKKDPGTGAWTLLRFCVDLRPVNNLTKKQPRSFPIPEEMFKEIGHHRYYCALDLKAGFHQILCEERAKERLTFWWNGQAYRFTRMPFGAVNSPAVFQTTVEAELRPHDEYSKVYIDDVLIWGDTVEDTMGRLEAVLTSLNESGLKTHPGKTTIFASGIEYLGFLLTKDGMKPQQAKVEAIRRIPSPTTQAEIASFLGLITYYRWFIQRYSEKAAPLRALGKAGVNVTKEWTEEHDACFGEIKDLLCT